MNVLGAADLRPGKALMQRANDLTIDEGSQDSYAFSVSDPGDDQRGRQHDSAGRRDGQQASRGDGTGGRARRHTHLSRRGDQRTLSAAADSGEASEAEVWTGAPSGRHEA